MKKLLFILCVFCYFPSAFAYQCINTVTGAYIGSGNATIRIPIADNLKLGEDNVFGNVGDYVECWNTMPSMYTDYLDLISVTPSTVLAGFDSGVYVNGSRYLSSQVNQINVFTLNDDLRHPVNIDMFFTIPNKLDKDLVINAGDALMVVTLEKWSTWGSNVGNRERFIWTFVADNRVALTTGTCTVNNNEPINIDFGLVPKSRIKNVGQGLNSITQDVSLNIDCEDLRLNQDIQVTLSANSASGDLLNTIPTTLSNLGVEMYYNNRLIAPMGSFLTPLVEGRSDAEVTFSLVKSAGVDSESLENGRFNASGSLVISLP